MFSCRTVQMMKHLTTSARYFSDKYINVSIRLPEALVRSVLAPLMDFLDDARRDGASVNLKVSDEPFVPLDVRDQSTFIGCDGDNSFGGEI